MPDINRKLLARPKTDERVSGGEGDSVVYSQGHPLWNVAAMGLSAIATLLPNRGANLIPVVFQLSLITLIQSHRRSHRGRQSGDVETFRRLIPCR
jgi:hypothetical protein